MKFATMIPITLVLEENGLPTGQTRPIELPRETYVWCRRQIRKLGLPPMQSGGFALLTEAMMLRKVGRIDDASNAPVRR